MGAWPQIVYLALVMMGVGVALAKHGEPRTPYSAWGTLLATAICLGLLWAGGFFAPLGM